ncbi:PAS domain-containing protein [Candidatus Saccharibacteria bacterium]|jgi:PAS domain S-box-containing protein|nr:PAS domain-containing protein [Candidatus Saccharibacteria bacterium]MBP9131993.1 PAS domain-containing protein [Candidatus Saccharibacteria bacterium]
MQKVPDKWYSGFNYITLGFSALVVASFALKEVLAQELAIDNFGITSLTALVAVLHLVVGLALFGLISKRHSEWVAAAISLSIFLVELLTIISLSGNFDSPFIALWLVSVLAAGAFGASGLVVASLLFNLYFVLWFADSKMDLIQMPVKSLLILASGYFVAIISHFLWKRSYIGVNYTPDTKVDELNSKLENERLKSQKLVQSISDGVVVVNDKGQIDFFNKAAQELTGWEVNDAVGLDYRSVISLTDQKNSEITDDDNPFTSVAMNNKPITNNNLVLKKKDGELVEVSIVASPVIEQSDVANGVIGLIRDIGVEKQRQRQQDEFISTASHEMRTPVAAIEGYLDLALSEKVSKIDDKARGFLEKAHASSRNLGLLFQDLLTSSKSEDGRIESHPEPIDTNQLLESLIEEIRFSTDKKGLELKLTYGGQPKGSAISPVYYIFVDPRRIREVITNLTNNAAKYTEKGAITVDLRGSQDVVQMSISDTGQGIPESDINHLFQKFYRVDNSDTRTIGGTGLGLFICKQIVELYKGRIWATSEVGRGSTFYVQLPRFEQSKVQNFIKSVDNNSASEAVVKPGELVTTTEVESSAQQLVTEANRPADPQLK